MNVQTTLPAMLLVLLAACASPDPAPAVPDPGPPAAAWTESVLLDSSAPWPMDPMQSASFPFDVPENVTTLEARFNWQGQQPGGISSNRDAVIIAPDGSEHSFMGADFPANPYACASPTCGPAQDRVERFGGPAAGTWSFELRGAYTATAYFVAVAFVEGPSDAEK